MHNTHKKSAAPRTRDLTAAVNDYIQNQKNNTFNYRQVSHAIGIDSPAALRAVAHYLVDLAADGDLIEVSPGKYKAPERTVSATGTFIRRSNGKNAVLTDEDNETINVAERNSMHALNGDRVLISIAARRRGVEPEAVVVDILEKKTKPLSVISRLTADSVSLKQTPNSLPPTLLSPKTS